MRPCAGRLTVFFHTNRFADRAQYSASRALAIHPMSSDGLELVRLARKGAEHAWRDGYAYTKVGVILEDLVAAELRPRTLFEDHADTERRKRLMGALDAINWRFGKATAVLATTGFKRQWRARADMKSPAYTTRISDVPVVRA